MEYLITGEPDVCLPLTELEYDGINTENNFHVIAINTINMIPDAPIKKKKQRCTRKPKSMTLNIK